MIPPADFLTTCSDNIAKQCKFVLYIATLDACKGCTGCSGYSHIFCKDCTASKSWTNLWEYLMQYRDDKKWITAWDIFFNNDEFKNKIKDLFVVVPLQPNEELKENHIKIVQKDKDVMVTNDMNKVIDFLKTNI